LSKIKPLKRFGQNYLKDQNILKKIAAQIDPASEDVILEIGPGNGALTEYIYGKTKNFYAVEIDKRVIDDLQSRFPDLKIIRDDFLKIDLNSFTGTDKKKIRIIGNIPYNLTSPIIFKLIDNTELISDAVIMAQYEVAKRMTANRGTKDYGILSVLLKYFSTTKLCFKVSPNAFYPKPNVTSATVHILMKQANISNDYKQTFINVVKASFSNRRKTLKNSLGNSIFKELNFADTGIDLSKRAEQLDINEFVHLTDFVQTQIGQSVST